MKKYGLRVLVGLIAFAIGLFGVWFLVSERKFHIQFNENLALDSETQTEKYLTNPNGKVEIRFVGYGKSENRPTFKFEIINHNSSPAKYWSFSEKEVWTFVKFNGKQREEWRCGTGSREFTLNSGESFEIEILADLQTYEFLKKDGFFDLEETKVCNHPAHMPPSHIHIPQGKGYRHICPSCGKVSVLIPHQISF